MVKAHHKTTPKPVKREKPRAITWRSPEHLYKRKTWQWYAAVGFFFLACIVFFLYVKAWFATLIVILAFWLFLRYAEDRPETVTYAIDDTGITIGTKKINYPELHSFLVEFVNHKPVILLETNYSLAMPITMIVPEEEFEAVMATLLQHIPLREEFSVMRWLSHFLYY